jgi:acetyl esterase/lipase
MGKRALSGGEFGRRLACALAVLALSAAGVRAQMSANPLEVGQKIEALGRALSPGAIAATAALYVPLQEQRPYAGIRIHRDLKYGPDERNRLDVFVPDPLPAKTRPTLVFVHGGDFVAGDKAQPKSPFYENIGVWAARHGLIGVNVTYRLAPAHPWPAGIEDVGAAVRWAIQNVAPFGGGPDRIFLMGHGAGAAHVAGYLSHPDLQPPGGPGVAGAILVSGVYDLTTMPMSRNLKAYYGGDPEHYPERSAQAGLVEAKIPLLLASAEFDPVDFEKQYNALRDALCAAEQCPRLVFLSRHNHMSEVYAINTKDTLLARAISDFIKAH